MDKVSDDRARAIMTGAAAGCSWGEARRMAEEVLELRHRTDCSAAIRFVNEHFQGDMKNWLFTGLDPAKAICRLLQELLELRRERDEAVALLEADGAALGLAEAIKRRSFLLAGARDEAALAKTKLDLVARELAEQIEASRRLRAELAVVATETDGVWMWQGDGEDHPESLSCPVVMSADRLRSLLGEAEIAKADRDGGRAQQQQLAGDTAKQERDLDTARRLPDPLDLDVIEARARAATPGRWGAQRDARGWYVLELAPTQAPPRSNTSITGWGCVTQSAPNAAHIAGMDPTATLAIVAEVRRLQGILDQLAVAPPAVFELVQALIGLLDEHDIPLGDLWAKVDDAGLELLRSERVAKPMALRFADVHPGDPLAGDPATNEGRIAIMRQMCPGLTTEQAQTAAEEARRLSRVTVADIRSLLEELFGQG